MSLWFGSLAIKYNLQKTALVYFSYIWPLYPSLSQYQQLQLTRVFVFVTMHTGHGIIYKKPKLKHGYIFGGEFKSITNEHHFSSIGEHCQSAAAQVWVWPLALCCVSSPFTGLLSNKIKNKKGDEGDFLIIFLERPLIRLLVYSILCWFLLELLSRYGCYLSQASPAKEICSQWDFLVK